MFSFPITAAVCLLLVWQTVQTRSLRENMLCFAEDGDMKIFGSSPKKAPAPAEDGEQEAEEYMRHKLAGNIDTAKDLGKDLASLVIDYRSNHALAADDPEVLLQCKVLFLHAACTCINRYCPGNILATAATQALMDTIKSDLSVVYDNYKGLGSATMYRLAEKDAAPSESIGKLFAQLCSKKEQRFVQMGIELYESCMTECEELCKGVSYR